MSADFSRDLELLLRSRHPLIFIETSDKLRAETLLAHVADRMQVPFHTWSRTKGLALKSDTFTPNPAEVVAEHAATLGRYAGEVFEALPKSQRTPASLTVQATTALNEVEKYNCSAIYNFQGLAADLDDLVVATKLADAARQFMQHEGGIVVTGDVPVDLPNVLRGVSTMLSLPKPHPNEYRDLAQAIYRDISQRTPIELELTKDDMRRLLRSLEGLTLMEAEKVLTKVMVEDGRLAPDDIARVIDAKREIIGREGLLEYYPLEETMTELAGLNGLKSWLAKRRAIVQQPDEARAFGLEFPKGVLLLGIQGSGKSLCAKTVAADWGLPLLKMDPSSLYNKYIGETERNFRRAVDTAEKMAPVVLWIDEIEKAFAGGGDIDGGVSQRVLGTFLNWLQDRKGDVFVVATANDISKLPPELLRKGRFDEIFFVDLPDAAARRDILKIHLTKRRRDASLFDLDRLSAASDGFSGAELEQAIVSALYTAFAGGEDLSTALLLAELAETVPLSQTMGEKLGDLRTWASRRAVAAN